MFKILTVWIDLEHQSFLRIRCRRHFRSRSEFHALYRPLLIVKQAGLVSEDTLESSPQVVRVVESVDDLGHAGCPEECETDL